MSWDAYIDAAYRKIAIADFHCEQLRIALAREVERSDRPSIPVQAFFEGVVTSVISAADQVAQAANSALSLGAKPGGLFDLASPEIESRVPAFRAWRQNPIGRDLRKLRVRMVHYSYAKSPEGGAWYVEDVGSEYVGPRELVAYAEASVAYAKELGFIANDLSISLATERTGHA